jgi:hypothetical protein
MSQVSLDERTFSHLVQVARAQQVSADELAAQVIREHLHTIERTEMDREMEAYAAQHSQILEKYRDRYIAMYHGEIVDHDSDLLPLYLRIDERFPDETVLLKQVKEQVEDIFTIRSPRLIPL